MVLDMVRGQNGGNRQKRGGNDSANPIRIKVQAGSQYIYAGFPRLSWNARKNEQEVCYRGFRKRELYAQR